MLAAGDRVWVQGPDGDVALTAVPRFPESGRGEAVAGGLVAPMPGTVLAVHVGPGDTVAQGQLLMIVEAMKMEHRITAPRAGTDRPSRTGPGSPARKHPSSLSPRSLARPGSARSSRSSPSEQTVSSPR